MERRELGSGDGGTGSSVRWLNDVGNIQTQTVESEGSTLKPNVTMGSWLKWTSETEAAQNVLNKMKQRLQEVGDDVVDAKESSEAVYKAVNTFLLKASARPMCPPQPRYKWPIPRVRQATPLDVEWVTCQRFQPYIKIPHTRVTTAPAKFTRLLNRTQVGGSGAGYWERVIFKNQLDEKNSIQTRSLTARPYPVNAHDTSLFSDRTRLPNLLPRHGQFSLTSCMTTLPSVQRHESLQRPLKAGTIEPIIQHRKAALPPDPNMLPLDIVSSTEQDADVLLPDIVFHYTLLKNPEVLVALFQLHRHLELVWQGAFEQIQVLIYNYSIPEVILKPTKLVRFLERYQFSPSAVHVCRGDLEDMLANKKEVVTYLHRAGQRFTGPDGEYRAAQCIQAAWRGMLARKICKFRDTVFVASAVLASAFLCFKRRQEMMRVLEQVKEERLMRTSQRMATLKGNWLKLQCEHHIAVQLPSLGHIPVVRQALGSTLPTMQNYQFCRCVGWLANPLCHVVYISPVKLTTDLTNFYNYFSLKILGSSLKRCSHRVRVMHVDRVQCFWDRGFNLSRLLVCAPSTLVNLKSMVSLMPGYVVPGLMDYQDIIVADALDMPIYGPPLGLQTRLNNKSHVSHFVAELGVAQPPGATHIHDIIGLVQHLSKLIALYPNMPLWLVKLNCDIDGQGTAYLRVCEHSFPFMPWILKEKLRFGKDWEKDENLRQDVIAELAAHLKIHLHLHIRFVNSQRFQSWRAFSTELAATGCMVQASSPIERFHSLTVAIEITPDGAPAQITSIAEQVKIDADSLFRVWGYSWPVTCVPAANLTPVRQIALQVGEACRKIGYVGHFAVDFIVFKNKRKLRNQSFKMWLVDLDPYCTELHSFHRCVMKLGGGPEAKPAVCSARLHHSNLAVYRWHMLEECLREHKIRFNHNEQNGSLVMLLDGEVRESIAMVTIHTDHKKALQLFSENLKQLHNYITDASSSYEYKTNFLDCVSEIERLLYRDNLVVQLSDQDNLCLGNSLDESTHSVCNS